MANKPGIENQQEIALPDANTARVVPVEQPQFVAMGSDMYLQARSAHALFKRKNNLTDDSDIEIDPETGVALLEPDVAIRTALGLVMLYDVTIVAETQEHARYEKDKLEKEREMELKKKQAEEEGVDGGMIDHDSVSPNFTDYTRQRALIRGYLIDLGGAALKLFPDEVTVQGSLPKKLADEMKRF